MPTRLLLVDADPAMQRMVEQTSLSLGLDAVCFKDAVTALDAIGRLKPALVITDYRLTGATFISFCERLAGMELAPSPPIMALITPEDQFDEAELRFLGVKSFVHKPPQLDDLLRTVRTELGLILADPKERNSARHAQPTPSESAALADVVAREVGRQLPRLLQTELPSQIALAYPREDMTLIAMEAVQQALPDISHQLIADLKPLIQERVTDITERLLRELLDKRLAEQPLDGTSQGT